MKDPLALTESDFKVFAIEGFAERMEALKTSLRPKLEKLAARLAPKLSEVTGHEMFVHTAKHARRTVNPPPETWSAFAFRARGYKAVPHLALCVARSGVHARVVLKDEALEARLALAKRIPRNAKALGEAIERADARDYIGWDTLHPPFRFAGDKAAFKALVHETALKTGHFDLGTPLGEWPGDDGVIEAFRALAPVYALAMRDLAPKG